MTNNWICKQQLLNSHNLVGLNYPRAEEMYLCPKLSDSCCTKSDQLEFYHKWKHEGIPKISIYYWALKQKVNDLNALVNTVLKINFNYELGRISMNGNEKSKTQQYMKNFYEANVSKQLSLYLNLVDQTEQYMSKLRASYFCVLCDFDQQQYFDIENKQFVMSLESCEDLSKNTVPQQAFLIQKIFQPLQQLIEVLNILNNNVEIADPRYNNKISEMIINCYESVQLEQGIDDCMDYCSHYKFNGFSEMIDGGESRLVFYINRINTYIQGLSNGSQLIASQTRLLAEKDFTALTNFSPLPDSLKRFNPQLINHMIDQQSSMEKQKEIDYQNFILNQQHSFEKMMDTKNLFLVKESSKYQNADLTTWVEKLGANLIKHLYSSNMDMPLGQLVKNIKYHSKFRIHYENIDPDLLQLINTVSNGTVSSFYKDTLITFKDFSKKLAFLNMGR